ncbi:hypothetical protein Btru_051984 [Bulinus truncatus]|nr:hypothetical protein Btru_051984 [Bulinus truncatus]
MGPKDEVHLAKSLIISLRGNKDEELICYKPSGETQKSFRQSMDDKIDKTDITQLDVEIIVSAANRNLVHCGGVAAAIARKAGYQLQKECEDFTKTHTGFGVTDVFTSSGGNLKAKYVIHAVGPKWDFYPDDDKSRCLRDLRHTVVKVLVEASCLGAKTIALPSISAGRSNLG